LKQDVLGDRGGYVVVAPLKPDESHLVRRISSSDADDVMPPVDSGKKLTAEQIALVRRWIA
jgi:hypothetical protein